MLAVGGCVTPQYAVRPTPAPDESAWAVQLEQTISAYQAHELEKQGARLIQPGERLWGYDVDAVLKRLARVTERPSLPYHPLLLRSRDVRDLNAVALADGRVYITSGMLNYLASRGSREDELAVILSHELGHTVAQHLVKRYQEVQREQLALSIVSLGSAIIASHGGSSFGTLANDAASLIANVAGSSFSQEQELEADQLGVRYLIRAGYDPYAAPRFLQEFARLTGGGGGFLSSHPYTPRRADDLLRYLEDLRASGQLRTAPVSAASREGQRARLLNAQRFYPVGSTSWTNLQRQIETLDKK